MTASLLWLHIRLKQFWRLLQSIGFGLVVVLLFVLSGMLLALIGKLQQTSAHEAALVILLLPLSIHFQRKDAPFIRLLHLPRHFLYLAEYQIITLPFALFFSIFMENARILLYTQLAAALLAFLPVLPLLQSARSFWKLKTVPLLAFEWRMGWRQYWLYLCLLLAIGTALSFLTAAPIVCLLLMAFAASNFYDTIEPKEWLLPFWYQPQFFLRKWWSNWSTYLVITSPLSISFLLFHVEYWHILFATILLTALFFYFLLIYKYAVYWPNRRRVYNQTPAALFLLGFVTLFFLPVSIYFLWRYYRRANRQLQYYFPKPAQT